VKLLVRPNSNTHQEHSSLSRRWQQSDFISRFTYLFHSRCASLAPAAYHRRCLSVPVFGACLIYINKAFTFLIGGARIKKLPAGAIKCFCFGFWLVTYVTSFMHLVSRHSYYICAGDCFLGPAFCAIVLPPPRPREIDRLQVPNHQIQIDIMNACSWVALFAR
jgi:hypothetical protein